MSKGFLIIADYEQYTLLTLEELSQSCNVSIEFVQDLMEYDIIHSQPNFNDQLLFNLKQRERVKTANRLQRDLEINLAGISVIIKLLDELTEARTRIELLEKHFMR